MRKIITTAELGEAKKYAKDLCRDSDNYEYNRGVIEIMAELFAEKEVFLEDRAEALSLEMGIKIYP